MRERAFADEMRIRQLQELRQVFDEGFERRAKLILGRARGGLVGQLAFRRRPESGNRIGERLRSRHAPLRPFTESITHYFPSRAADQAACRALNRKPKRSISHASPRLSSRLRIIPKGPCAPLPFGLFFRQLKNHLCQRVGRPVRSFSLSGAETPGA